MATIAVMIYQIEAQTAAMEKSLEQVKTRLDDMDKSMISSIASGELLGDALEKMGELGLEAIERMAEAVPELIGHAVELGNQMYELSLKTGASVENLSALRYVAAASGTDFETFNAAFFKMEAAFGATGEKADKLETSLAGVGLSMQKLKNERPDEAFIDIVSALEHVGNAADRNALAMQLFSRGAKEMAGLFHEDIRQMMQEAHDLGLVMSTETAAAAHAAEVGWKSFTMQLEAATTSVAAQIMPALVAFEQVASDVFKALVDSYRQATGSVNDGLMRNAIIQIGEGFIRGLAAAAGFAQGAIEGLQNVTAFAIRAGEAIVNVGAALIKVGTLGTVDEKGKTILDQTQAALHQTFDALESLKEPLAHAGDEAKKAFSTFEQLADDMAGKFTSAYLKAAASIDDFAKKSHDAGTTVASNTSMATEATNRLIAAWDKLSGLGQDFHKVLVDINPEILKQVEYWLKMGATVDTLAQAYPGLTKAQVEAIKSLKDEEDSASDSLQKWLDNIGKLAPACDDATPQCIKDFQDINDSIMGINADWEDWNAQIMDTVDSLDQVANKMEKIQSFSMTYDLSTDAGIAKYQQLNPMATISWSNAQIEAFIKGGGNLQQLIEKGIINPYGGMAHMDTGGPIRQDGPIYAHAGEYVIPKDGALVSGSGGGDVNVAVRMQVSGLLDARTQRELARGVSDEVMRNLKATRKLRAAT